MNKFSKKYSRSPFFLYSFISHPNLSSDFYCSKKNKRIFVGKKTTQCIVHFCTDLFFFEKSSGFFPTRGLENTNNRRRRGEGRGGGTKGFRRIGRVIVTRGGTRPRPRRRLAIFAKLSELNRIMRSRWRQPCNSLNWREMRLSRLHIDAFTPLVALVREATIARWVFLKALMIHFSRYGSRYNLRSIYYHLPQFFPLRQYHPTDSNFRSNFIHVYIQL